MPSIPGKYQHYKNENIEDYFIAVGVPFVGRKMMAMSSPLMEITLDGDTMTIKNSSLFRTVEHTFRLGEEYDERMPNTTIKSITKIENESEMVTTSVIPETGDKCGRHYLFTDDECIVTKGKGASGSFKLESKSASGKKPAVGKAASGKSAAAKPKKAATAAAKSKKAAAASASPAKATKSVAAAAKDKKAAAAKKKPAAKKAAAPAKSKAAAAPKAKKSAKPPTKKPKAPKPKKAAAASKSKSAASKKTSGAGKK